MKPPEQQPVHRQRVVALINPVLHWRSTCVELLKQNVNLVGIAEAQPRQAGLPLKTLRRIIRKSGFQSAMSSVAARAAYVARNRSLDSEVYDRLFDRAAIEEALHQWSGPTAQAASYDELFDFISNLQPDVLVVHSQSWVSRKVRELAAAGLVLGGHPGVTPHYRGSHSSFWALLNGQPEMVGWTAFHVDKGVDTGDVIVQGRLSIEGDDSYMTLNWRGMKAIAEALAEAIDHFDRTGEISRQPHESIPPGSDYGQPGISAYRQYMKTTSVR